METIEARFAAESGVKFAAAGDYKSAVDRFTEAITIHPYDFRFFLNRSFCYFYMSEFEKSLDDADQAIRLSKGTVNAKPHYRRALALLALNFLEPALQSFEHVLRIDSTCPVSQEKRCAIRAALLLDAGFSKADADALAQGHEPLEDLTGVKKGKDAAEALADGPIIADMVNLNLSSGDSEPVFLPEKVRDRTPDSDPRADVPVLDQVLSAMPELLDMDPVTNPIGFHALTVSNVAQQAGRQLLIDLFTQYGEVAGIFRLKLPSDRPVADGAVTVLVQYTDAESPVRAVETLRAAIFNGITANPIRPLTLKLTTSQSQKDNKFLTFEQAEQKCIAAGECFDWRSPIGCLDEDCGRLHSRANHRLDSHSFFLWLKANTGSD